MDPQVVWDQLLAAISDGDYDEALDCALCLIEWLERQGFPPSTFAVNLPDVWNRFVCHCICQQVVAFGKDTEAAV